MPRFIGFRREEWEQIKPLTPPEPIKRGKGMPHTPWKKVFNSIAYILFTGCRWCDLPKSRHFAPKTTAHRWLVRWELDGTWDRMKRKVLEIAQQRKLIRWDRASIDGSFSPWERRRRRSRIWMEGQRSYAT
jgi:transposase